MLALLYLIVVFVLGYHLVQAVLPWVVNVPRRQSLAGTVVPVPQWMIQLPVAWLLGALVINWTTFVLADLTRSMHTGAWLTLAMGTCVGGVLFWKNYNRPFGLQKSVRCWRDISVLEAIYLIFSLVLSSFIAWHTLMVKDGVLLIGNTVWSDFGPHLAIIRSFSLGENFPPQYPHFPEGSIRYHFLFQFMVATLESLGMRIDWAFNLPSIFSLVSLFLLLYVLAVAITGQRWVGVLTGFLFIFRSSFAVFTHIKENLANDNLWQAIWDVSLHIGKTEHENWGLWAQNVYANQRHFAFSIGVLIVLLLALLPLLQSMIAARQQANPGFINGLRTYFVGKDNWWPASWQRAITLGLLLGAIGFWNGAVVITALIILFVLALFCRHRGEFLIIAALAALLALLQQRWFIGTGAVAVKPSWYFGFLAEHKTLVGTAAFYLELLGMFFPLFLLAIFNTPRGYKALALAFIAPLIFASLVSLTIDINGNHKFIMLAVILSNIFIAALIVRFFQSDDNALRIMAVLFTVLLTVTGWVDLLTLYNMNKNNVTIAMNDPVTTWVSKNSNPKEVFLTDWAVLHPVQFAGRPIYFGWPYYAWSAGYDTDSRAQIMKRIYSTASAAELSSVVHKEGIGFIVIDDAVRNSPEYRVNEPLITQTFKLVFSDEKDHTRIFRVD
ncbi:MAG: hypothetical protein HOP02_11885 [Methylococcaceae bacterium]|nr:hypothetical protein [Methylococcaceae bacterium]